MFLVKVIKHTVMEQCTVKQRGLLRGYSASSKLIAREKIKVASSLVVFLLASYDSRLFGLF